MDFMYHTPLRGFWTSIHYGLHVSHTPQSLLDQHSVWTSCITHPSRPSGPAFSMDFMYHTPLKAFWISIQYGLHVSHTPQGLLDQHSEWTSCITHPSRPSGPAFSMEFMYHTPLKAFWTSIQYGLHVSHTPQGLLDQHSVWTSCITHPSRPSGPAFSMDFMYHTPLKAFWTSSQYGLHVLHTPQGLLDQHSVWTSCITHPSRPSGPAFSMDFMYYKPLKAFWTSIQYGLHVSHTPQGLLDQHSVWTSCITHPSRPS